MKSIYNLFGILFVLSMSAHTSAQPVYGFKGGFNFANMLVIDDYNNEASNCKMNLGFNAGVTAEFPINEIFSIETGLFLSERGYKTVIKENDYRNTLKFTLFYLDIPLTVKRYLDMSGRKLYGLLGPYFGTGIYALAKDILRSEGNYEKDTQKIKWGSDGDIKRYDFGLSFGAGVEIEVFHFELMYNLGLVNISNNVEDGEKMNHRTLALSAGYWF